MCHLAADDENRFHRDWLSAVEAALDAVDAVTAPRALVTAGSGQFWSTGLDSDWLSALDSQHADYLDRVNALFARTLASPTITVAALNGHTFAAAAMWSLAHDLRVMRADRGFFCLPEVDIDMSFQRGPSQLIRSRLNPGAAHEAMTTGRRYGGEQALAAGIVDALDSPDRLLAAAVEIARPLASKAKPNRAEIKETTGFTAHSAHHPNHIAIRWPGPANARNHRCTPVGRYSNLRPGSRSSHEPNFTGTADAIDEPTVHDHPLSRRAIVNRARHERSLCDDGWY